MIPEVKWDGGIKPIQDSDRVREWDTWFEGTGDEESLKVWRAAKDVWDGNVAMLERWAFIVEANRLSALSAASEKTPQSKEP